jgi:phage recombination protein Bet
MTTTQQLPAVHSANALAPASPLKVMAQRFQIEPARLLEVLRATVIKPSKDGHQATNEEIAAFTIVANEYGLNPFTKEIHAFVGSGGAVVPIVGVDGWTKIVNRHETFDGVEFEEANDSEGKPLATTCVMYVKGRGHATKVTEWFSECRRQSIPWQTMPRRMLRHKAFMQTARLCFGLAGIYDEDEARDILRQEKGEVVEQLPTGRHSARRPPPAAAPAPEPAAPPEPEPEPAPPPEEPVPLPPEGAADDRQEELDDQARERLVADIARMIREALSLDQLRVAGIQMTKQRAWLGEGRYQALLVEYQAQGRKFVGKKP